VGSPRERPRGGPLRGQAWTDDVSPSRKRDGSIEAFRSTTAAAVAEIRSCAVGKVNWRMPNPAGGFGNFGQKAENPVKSSASADLDSDGRDEALIVIDKTLLCIGIKGDDTTGKILWRVEFPAAITYRFCSLSITMP